MISKHAVKLFPSRNVHRKQAGAAFEFCTFIRKPIKGLDNKLFLIILTLLETLIATVIVHTYNKKLIPGRLNIPSDRCIEQVHKRILRGWDRDILSKVLNPMIVEAGKVQVKATTGCVQLHMLSLGSILY